jgi:hypothetical protein
MDKKFYNIGPSGMYYKPMMIVNDDPRIVNKLDASLTDDARVIIYDRHMFIVQDTGVSVVNVFAAIIIKVCNKLVPDRSFRPKMLAQGQNGLAYFGPVHDEEAQNVF